MAPGEAEAVGQGEQRGDARRTLPEGADRATGEPDRLGAEPLGAEHEGAEHDSGIDRRVEAPVGRVVRQGMAAPRVRATRPAVVAAAHERVGRLGDPPLVRDRGLDGASPGRVAEMEDFGLPRAGSGGGGERLGGEHADQARIDRIGLGAAGRGTGGEAELRVRRDVRRPLHRFAGAAPEGVGRGGRPGVVRTRGRPAVAPPHRAGARLAGKPLAPDQTPTDEPF